MINNEYTMPERRDFANSADAKELLDRIHAVMSAGMNPEKGRTVNSWRKHSPYGKDGHLLHAIHHLLNLHHHQTLDKLDAETGLPELDHALCRVFFMAMQHHAAQKEKMRYMEEMVAD